RRNTSALQRLSAFFYNRLQAMETIRLFDQVSAQSQKLEHASQAFRIHTMEVLRLAFLSSAVLEFFTALSIALTAVYLGFSYLGELDFGHYGAPISLFTGLLLLLLAPEFYQPLRELGTFYHAKAQALGAAVAIVEFFTQADDLIKKNEALRQTTAAKEAIAQGAITLQARELIVLSPEGTPLVGPLNFSIKAGEHVAIIGQSGSGKTSLFNALLGFLPYQGSLTINGVELTECELASWRQQISWVRQNPQLFHGTVRENILLGAPHIADQQLAPILLFSHIDEFIDKLPGGLDYVIGDRASGLSVGQAQRIALARALLQNGQCWLLDEPTSSLDASSEQQINHSLQHATQGRTMLLITHKLDPSATYDQILHLHQGVLLNHIQPVEFF
ncbi:MAG: ATP-binding cassette domain-containing protein, partial [Vibrionaceae bacterium]